MLEGLRVERILKMERAGRVFKVSFPTLQVLLTLIEVMPIVCDGRTMRESNNRKQVMHYC